CLPGFVYHMNLGEHQLSNFSLTWISSPMHLIITHPNNNKDLSIADNTLVQLKKPVTFMDEICPISLPGPSTQFPGGSPCIRGGCSLGGRIMGRLCSPLTILLLALLLLRGNDESQDQPVFSRIIGGQDAQENEWPWQVSIQENGDHVCGGSLISAQWVVSAAHCFDPSVPHSQYCLVLGANQLLNPSLNQVESEVKQIIPHPDYQTRTHVADIALVKLKEPAPFTKSIRPISLPGASLQFPAGKGCWVTGWGNVEVNTPIPGSRPPEPLKPPILSRAACNDRYNTLKPDPFLSPEAVKSDMISARYMDSAKGFCHGDSGGPLACQQDNTWYLAGVVSWFMITNESGIICSDPRFPGVFTRVTAYDSSIQGHVNSASPSAITSPGALILTALLLTAL
ncbi:serine protease 27-like, partial [Emydura macquarii macquarii]|uniref:serine protease 27-like n=1 Tax=Emydura macquarii macquarii TaxID=1129001 RepID=UPI00352A70ED